MTNEQAITRLGDWLKAMDYDPEEDCELEQAVALSIEALRACERAERSAAPQEPAKEPDWQKCPQCRQRTTTGQLIQEGMCSDCTGD